MSIKIVKGNVVDAVLNGECHFMLHVANSQGVMGSGVAKEVKHRIPSAFESYKKLVDNVGKSKTLGMFSRSSSYRCFNLHAQEYYGREKKRYLSYKALIESCMSVSDYDCHLQDLFETPNLKIAIPYLMGSDRAGGDWEVVCEILEAFFGHHEIIAYKL